MGKTKIKTIDDSAPSTAAVRGRKDELVEKLKAELATGEEKLEVGSEQLEKETPKPTSKIKHPISKKIRGKKYQQVIKDLDRSKSYPLNEAVDMVKKLSYAKFNATLEAHINTMQTGLRGLVSLPYASGKKIRILAFPSTSLRVNSKGATEQEYEGVIFGDDSTIEEISKGKLDFDLIVTTPEWMPKLAKVAKILGPKGLMPNPKNGTVTDDLKKAIASFQAGKTEYKTENKAAVIHLGLGKLDQPTEELSANVSTLLQTLGKTRVKKVSLSPTQGASVKVDLASI